MVSLVIATVTLTVNPVDDVNPAAGNDAFATNEDVVLATTVAGNDSVGVDAPGTWTLETNAASGNVVMAADGSFTYTPTLNFNGADSFTYRLTDSDGEFVIATVNLTVNPIDDVDPAAGNDAFVTNEDVAIVDTVAGNDSVGADAPGIWTLETAAANGVVVMAANGGFTYTPNLNFNGTDSFTYRLTDSDGEFVIATVNLTVNPIDDVDPAAGNDAFATNEDVVLADTVTTNDSVGVDAPGVWTLESNAANGNVVMAADGSFTYTPNLNFNGADAFTYRLTDSDGEFVIATVNLTVNPIDDVDPAAGNDAFATNEDIVLATTVAGNDSVGVDAPGVWTLETNAANGNVAMAANGSFTYTPNLNFNGADSFTYRLTDSDGEFVIATVNLTVNPVDDVDPAAGNDAFATNEDVVLADTVATNDSVGVDAPGVWTLESNAANGNLVMAADGSFTYTPNVNFNGADSFTYRLTDSDGEFVIATVNLTVNPVDDVDPAAGNDAFVTNEDVVLATTVAGNDTVGVDAPGVWSLETNATTGNVVMAADGSFTYTPNLNFNGADSFTYRLTDSDGEFVIATVNLTVNPIDDVDPAAGNDAFATNEDIALADTVAGNDSVGVDAPAVWSLETAATNGAVVMGANGSFTYNPNANFNGTDSFTYRLTDSDGEFVIATVNLTINPVNDAFPVANDDAYTLAEDGVSYAARRLRRRRRASGGACRRCLRRRRRRASGGACRRRLRRRGRSRW